MPVMRVGRHKPSLFKVQSRPVRTATQLPYSDTTEKTISFLHDGTIKFPARIWYRSEASNKADELVSLLRNFKFVLSVF
jgi:hypothetical protein